MAQRPAVAQLAHDGLDEPVAVAPAAVVTAATMPRLCWMSAAMVSSIAPAASRYP
ncbi:MAG: hypothetical protein ACR2H2_18250 [Solirubrobacteraceae bacterium]